MKVNSVLSYPKFSFKGDYKGAPTQISDPFLYTLDTNVKKKKELKTSSVPWLLGALAVAAVATTLIRLRGKNYVQESVVNLADEKLGLNRISSRYEKNVREIKSRFLYPIVATMKGDMSFKQNELIKKGLIISTEKDIATAKEIYDATYAHAKALGIHCIRMPVEASKAEGKGLPPEAISRKRLTRAARAKWLLNAIEEAKNYYKKTGDFAMIFFGDLGKLANLKISKGTAANIEEKIVAINSENYPGVIWAGWTSAQKSIPEFYNHLPVLITKM